MVFYGKIHQENVILPTMFRIETFDAKNLFYRTKSEKFPEFVFGGSITLSNDI